MSIADYENKKNMKKKSLPTKNENERIQYCPCQRICHYTYTNNKRNNKWEMGTQIPPKVNYS